ncbi:hypothetical protein Ddye_007937 [Dipteronia dyeriana]|uniref:DUF1985 domain-containing protein n=1 Tax=Dipteronia dyeriana TaxID=168575 RepID=A0AAE0CS54_9ROSI|nr:hypothetical protein Ddye_007937 [Dipteronia dyeriana]
MQFKLGNRSVRFSKVEFCLITGLRFGVVPDTTKYAEVENGIHQRCFPGADEVSLEEIRGVVTVAEFGEAYHAILMGVDERFKILVWQFRMVEDLDAFDAFPWGAHVYRHSIYSFKHALNGATRRVRVTPARKGRSRTYSGDLQHIRSISRPIGKNF